MTTTPTATGLSQWKAAQREREKRIQKEKDRASGNGKVYQGCPDGRPHHYILPPPNGPKVTGECKHCGKSREYSNFDENGWLGTTITEAY